MIASFTRTKKLRDAMRKAGIDVYVMVNSDPHESEYLPDYWKSIEWMTGFRGEVATVIVTQEDALLWTDSRFFLSGAQQLKGSPFQLKKMKIDAPATEWLLQWKKGKGEGKEDLVIAGDKRVIFGAIAEMIGTNVDLIEPIWKGRPGLPMGTIKIYEDKYNGETAKSKIERILDKLNVNLNPNDNPKLLLTALDDIAWTLNLRGDDIHCTPVFMSYLLLSKEKKVLYVNPNKETPEVREYLTGLDIEVEDYEKAPLDTPSAPNPVPLMKAIKNPVEIAGFREAMRKDGIALTRFYHWLEEKLTSVGEFVMNPDGSIGISNEVTELDCVEMLKKYRQEQEGYMDESFDAIVAWNEHGALPHYEPRKESNVPITGDGLLLIDTGGHYLEGTTDITRTIGVGRVSAAMKRDYTLVLKGHIRLAQAVFPKGTRGDQLDALARMDLWRDGKTYRHGTSHGVGHYLGVHEGPESVRMEHNPQVLLEGMFFSNEPAIYLNEKYGIRHENCVLVRNFDVDIDAPGSTPCDQDEQGEFLCLDTLTLCYIDTSCIDMNIMTQEEVEWVNNYNRWVLETLSPDLEEVDRLWLGVKCQAI